MIPSNDQILLISGWVVGCLQMLAVCVYCVKARRS